MDTANRLERGERYFVTGTFVVIVAEALTFFGAVVSRAWLGSILDFLFLISAFWLANCLYAGSAVARKVVPYWAGFQMLLGLAGVICYFACEDSSLVRSVGIAPAWLGVVKLVGWGFYCTVLTKGGPAWFLVAVKSGGDVAELEKVPRLREVLFGAGDSEEAASESPATAPLPELHGQVFLGLLKIAPLGSLALFLGAIFWLLYQLLLSEAPGPQRVAGVVEAGGLTAMSLLLLGTALQLRSLPAPHADWTRFFPGLEQLTSLLGKQVVVVAVVIVGAVLALLV
jgi:hypothetical protein